MLSSLSSLYSLLFSVVIAFEQRGPSRLQRDDYHAHLLNTAAPLAQLQVSSWDLFSNGLSATVICILQARDHDTDKVTCPQRLRGKSQVGTLVVSWPSLRTHCHGCEHREGGSCVCCSEPVVSCGVYPCLTSGSKQTLRANGSTEHQASMT